MISYIRLRDVGKQKVSLLKLNKIIALEGTDELGW
jgi:hypothetical protein